MAPESPAARRKNGRISKICNPFCAAAGGQENKPGGSVISERALGAELLQIDGLEFSGFGEFGAPDLVQALVVAFAEADRHSKPDVEIVHAFKGLHQFFGVGLRARFSASISTRPAI